MIGLKKSFRFMYSNTHLKSRETFPLTLSLTALFECNKLTAMLAESANASVGGFRQRAVSLGHKLFPKPVVDRGSQCTQCYSTILLTLKPMALK